MRVSMGAGTGTDTILCHIRLWMYAMFDVLFFYHFDARYTSPVDRNNTHEIFVA